MYVRKGASLINLYSSFKARKLTCNKKGVSKYDFKILEVGCAKNTLLWHGCYAGKILIHCIIF